MSDTPEDLDSPEGEECPWEEPGAVRRDSQPHRGDLLMLLGTASLVCGVLACLIFVTALVGLPLAAVTWRWAGRDLARMDAGLMDPAGRGQTEGARDTAWLGGRFNLLGAAFGFVLFLALRGMY